MQRILRGPRLLLRRAGPAEAGIRLLELADPDGWELPSFQPGAHIDLYLPDGKSRSYSLCNDPADRTRYLVAVKREADSRGGSRYLHDSVRAGDMIEVSLPRCTLPLAVDAARHVFIAGGIGVTPFLAMAAALGRQGAAFHLHVLFRNTPPVSDLLAPLLAAGQASLHDTSHGRPRLGALLGDDDDATQVYICGPAGLAEAVGAVWPAARLHVEHFVPPVLPPDPEARDFTLVLARSGRSIPVAANSTVLAALRMMDVAVDTSCEGGICGACRIGWIEGTPLHRDRVLSPEERKTALMACVAGCAGPRLVLDL